MTKTTSRPDATSFSESSSALGDGSAHRDYLVYFLILASMALALLGYFLHLTYQQTEGFDQNDFVQRSNGTRQPGRCHITPHRGLYQLHC
jgi:hypothetical protein